MKDKIDLKKACHKAVNSESEMEKLLDIIESNDEVYEHFEKNVQQPVETLFAQAFDKRRIPVLKRFYSKGYLKGFAAAACFLVMFYGFFNFTENKTGQSHFASNFDGIEKQNIELMTYLDEQIKNENEKIEMILQEISLVKMQVESDQQNIFDNAICNNIMNSSFDDFMVFEIEGYDFY